MKRLFVALAILVSLVSTVPVNPANAASCQYVLGFATLHDLIPEITGACVTDVQYNPANGDGLQQTTNGLMVWRKADNFTAFTDGYHSWVNGPHGVQMRLNTERFDWESDTPQASLTAPEPAPAATPTAAPVVSDRAAMAEFANKVWPIWVTLAAADARLGQELDAARDGNDQIGAIDRAVKTVEPLVARTSAVTAPDVPYAGAMLSELTTGVSAYYEGLKQLNWGIVSKNGTIVNAALRQVRTAYEAMDQSFWEFKAAVEKQGLTYKNGKWQ